MRIAQLSAGRTKRKGVPEVSGTPLAFGEADIAGSGSVPLQQH
jgi:hypothetical protein